MAKVNLTRDIQNDDGYIDDVVAQIEAIADGETLEVMITCVGGETFQGDRLHRAILEHSGKTKATVVGLAASMGGVLLSAFDDVELDVDAEIMLHKAHIPQLPLDEYTPEQTQMCESFNKKAYSRLLKKGVNKEFIDEVFLSDESKDYWLTAKETEELGIGHVVAVERRDGQAYKIAASLDLNKIKNHYKKEMGIFSKDKPVARVANLADGRQVIFNGVKEEIIIGSKLQVVGSNESLGGSVMLSKTSKATLNDEAEVTSIDEIESTVNTADEEKEAAENRLSAIEESIAKLTALFGEEEESDEEKAAKKAKEEEEAEAKKVADSASSKEIMDALVSVKDALTQVKTFAKLSSPDNKHENVTNNLSASERAIGEQIALRNEIRNQK